MAIVLKRAPIFLALGLLTVSAFFIRLENFKGSDLRSIDEIVYYRMALQVKDNMWDYNTIPYGKELAATGRDLPPYFFKPLYKHPPFFSFFAALFLKIFGNQLVSVEYVSLLFGVLMIPLVFFLGKKVYNWQAGLLAATLFSLDPMSIICSQKVWMETTNAFFIVLAVYFFIKALQDKTENQFILSGLASGLAAANKYNGVLATVIFMLYALIYDRGLFRNRKFLVGLAMPAVVLLPWFVWNFSVYGPHYLFMQGEFHSTKKHLHYLLIAGGTFVIIASAGYVLYRKIRSDFANPGVVMRIILGAACLLLLWPSMCLSLQLMHLPLASWGWPVYSDPRPTYYFERLLEFSSIYLVTLIAYFTTPKDMSPSERVLYLSPLVILAFFTVWAGYQSRYIIASIPFLIIIASGWLWRVYVKAEGSASFLGRVGIRAGIILILIFSIAKMQFINIYISFPNDLCYF